MRKFYQKNLCVHTKNQKNRKLNTKIAAAEKRKKIGKRQHIYENYIKRPQDFCLSLGAILILSPVMAAPLVFIV